ncbi:MAG: hypothetical protein IJ074_01745 [Clostridia bacterium]|nr:hypothetical protein [Clostridia bacterium]
MAYRRELAVVLLIVLLLTGVWLLVSRIESANDGAQTQFVQDAVRNAALTCYAVEGAYPEDLEYLRAHYGLAYDESRYYVNYDAFASNLVPEITVIEVGASR